jgi:hypothetical protein
VVVVTVPILSSRRNKLARRCNKSSVETCKDSEQLLVVDKAFQMSMNLSKTKETINKVVFLPFPEPATISILTPVTMLVEEKILEELMAKEWQAEELAQDKKLICKAPELFIQDRDKINSTWQTILKMCILSTWDKVLKCHQIKATPKFHSPTTTRTKARRWEQPSKLTLTSEV